MATVLFIIIDDATVEEPGAGKHKQGAASNSGGLQQTERMSSEAGSAQVEDLHLENLVREKSNIDTSNPFSPSSWYRAPPRSKIQTKVSPPPPPPPYVAPVPTAPPLPYKYFGSYEDGSKRILLLLKGEQIYPVLEGDTLDNIYLVQKVVGSKIEIVYLPLGITQTIDTGINTFTSVK